MLTLYTALVVLLLFGATIFVHELGHFLVARWCGMIVEVFSIGFGPAIWKRRIGGITYKIGWFPFGGYVALPQMDPAGPAPGDPAKEKTPIPPAAPWKRILVSLAGVTGNMILAVLLACIVYAVGKPSAPHERNCIVGWVDTNSAAFAQGLRIGDEIIEANGEAVGNWDDLLLPAALNDEVRLVIRGAEGERIRTLPTEKNWAGVRTIPGIGWVNACEVAGLVPGSSAAQAGIRAGDVIREFGGVRLFSREHLIDLVNGARDTEVSALIERDGQRLELLVRPKYDESAGRALIGVMFNTMDVDYDVVVHPRPFAQLKSHATAIFRFLHALVTPREARAASQAVGGPVAILTMFWWTVQKSFILALWFTCFFNVNLAILNLIPVPILDGGHVLFALWQVVTGRPVGQRLFSAVMNFFTVLIVAVFLLLTYRDVIRWIVPQAAPLWERVIGGEEGGGVEAEPSVGSPSEPSRGP